MTQAVLKRIAEGDKTAVQECLKQYGGLVWSLAKKMSQTVEDAEDAIQEIFIEIWKNAYRFDETKSSEATFISMISRRRLIDRLRAGQSRISPMSLETLTVEPINDFDSTLISNMDARQAAEALQGLKPEQRDAIKFSIIHGLSHREISEKMGVPVGTVKTNVRRGLIQMRTMLGINGATAEEDSL